MKLWRYLDLSKYTFLIQGKELPKSGLLMEVDLMDFIKAIIISPYADQWFHDVVINLTKKWKGTTQAIALRNSKKGTEHPAESPCGTWMAF